MFPESNSGTRQDIGCLLIDQPKGGWEITGQWDGIDSITQTLHGTGTCAAPLTPPGTTPQAHGWLAHMAVPWSPFLQWLSPVSKRTTKAWSKWHGPTSELDDLQRPTQHQSQMLLVSLGFMVGTDVFHTTSLALHVACGHHVDWI